MSRPVLEIVIGTIMIVDQKWMAAVTKSPVKAGMCSAERAEGKGISHFLGGLQDDFGVGD